MTTPTPTSNGVAALGGGVPPGLPDAAALARLAGEFFAALPGGSQDLSLPFGAAAPQPAKPVLAVGNRAPALAPASASPSSAAPEAAVDAASGAGRTGAPALGVPEAYGAALPSIPVPPQRPGAPGLPSSPYYFLGEASAYPSAAGSDIRVPEDRVTAQSFGLPGEAELRALLHGIDGGNVTPPLPSLAPPRSTSSTRRLNRRYRPWRRARIRPSMFMRCGATSPSSRSE